MQATSVSHIAVCVKDMDKSLAFYRDILGRPSHIIAEEMDQGRDYTYVTDIAEALRAVLDAPMLPHGLYNITAGTWVTFQEILDQVVELSPSTQVVAPAASQVRSGSEGYGRGPLSGHRLFDDLGWTPKYDLKAGLADYIKWRKDANFVD